MKYYLAYGSNMSFAQMKNRCPDAVPVGTATIKGHRLAFKYHATIEPQANCEVPVGVWEISDEDEARLDSYEGYPAYVGESGDWMNECPGFETNECFCMKNSIRKMCGKPLIEEP